MSIICECGEELKGDTCMLCGWTANVYSTITPGENPTDETPDTIVHDDQQSGTLGESLLDISDSIHIMDTNKNTIFDLQYTEVECSTDMLGALCIKHNGTTTRLKGQDTKMWLRAIKYKMNTPTWYLEGDEDCEIMYGDIRLGITPCVINPPFSWEAFRTGKYDITVQRPGAEPKQMNIKCQSTTRTIRYTGGEPAVRIGERP